MFDPRAPSLKRTIASGKSVGVIWLSLGSVALVELAARAKPDAIVIDMQHGLWDRRDLEAAIGVVPSSIPVIVRVAENSALSIGTALDAGAEGVIVPLIESADEAARAVSYCKYPPHGIRSGGGVRPLQDFVATVDASEDIAVFLMVETAKGVANVTEIANADGVDMLFIGTGDLALSIGTFPQPKHEHAMACAVVHRASRKAWVPCGIFTMSAEMAAQRRAQGYRMVVTANDIDMAQRGFGAAADHFRGPAPAANTVPLEPEPVMPAQLAKLIDEPRRIPTPKRAAVAARAEPPARKRARAVRTKR
jgi:2-keto-3-deoxy-L-rhamnonate aldolase RhmA